ncbi:signal peptidase I [Candidatus Dependentiae bacterium]|nr:signal peptidase I [Candidatus Dependentiae bacterium]
MVNSKTKKKTKSTKKRKKKSHKFSFTFDILIILSILILGGLVHFYIGSIYIISNDNMSTFLNPGSRVFVSKIHYGIINPVTNESTELKFGAPKRGDVILFKSSKSDNIIFMRILGIPGDKVSYRYDTILINSKILKKQYYRKRQFRKLHTIKLKENMFFVAGDNVDNDTFGGNFEIVSRQQILGKVIFK